MSGETRAHALPLVVIGGYLGAGKTTLINHLLREAAGAGATGAIGATGQGGRRRIAVLVNDFGEVSIDADLIIGADGGADGGTEGGTEGGSDAGTDGGTGGGTDRGVVSLAGGCVCCSFGADLVGALVQVGARAPRPDVVLVETSGVGLPAAVARTAALVPAVRVEGIVVVADALALRRQVAERYVGSTVRQQLQEADLVLLTKTDLAPPSAATSLTAWLRDEGIAAPCMALPAPGEDDGRLADLVFGPALGRDPGAATCSEPRDRFERLERPDPADRLDVVGRRDRLDGLDGPDRPDRAFTPRPIEAAGSRYTARTLRFAAPLDVAAALGEALRAQGVLRAKGLLLDRSGQWMELQLAGGRVDRRPAASTGRTPRRADEAAGRLVSIELRRR